jgi:Allene oxide cyclase barrel like domain
MRSYLTSTASAVAGLGALTLSTLAHAGTTTNAPPSHRDLSVISTDGPFVDVDTAQPAGLSMGDQFVWLNKLSVDGKEIGQHVGQCTIVQFTTWDDPALFNCFDTLELPGGTITVAELARTEAGGKPGLNASAITGGTGTYRSARGQVRTTWLPDGTKRLDIELF